MEFYFKRKRRFKVLCFLIIFALLLEIPMPAYAANLKSIDTLQANDISTTSDTSNASSSSSATTNIPAIDPITTKTDTSETTNGTDEADETNITENTASDTDSGNAGLPNMFNVGTAADTGGMDEGNTVPIDSADAGKVANTEHEALTELTDLREPNVKYFLNSDGTQTASVYDHDVHYLADDGTYQDIDNSLKAMETSGGKDILTNKENSTDFTLAKDASEGNLVSINKDGYNLKWRLESADASKAQNTTMSTNGLLSNTTLASEADPDPERVTDTISSAEYNNILGNVNLEYIMKGSELKENIKLENANVPSQISFVLTTKALYAKETDGQINFCNADGETVFQMSEALMYDAKGAESTDIQVKLTVLSETNEANQYKLTITPSSSWLKDPARVYPVVLDPTITTQSYYSVSDAHVNSDSADTNYGSSTSMVVGTNSSGKSRAYVKFNLPTQIQKSDRIVAAEIGLYTNTGNSYSIFSGSQISAAPTMYMFAPSASWSTSTLTWNNQPTYNSKTIDYANIPITNGTAQTGWYTWDVTSMVDSWYSGTPNYGVVIKDTESTQYSKRAYFYSSNYSDSSCYPLINISYVNTIGLEDYWTYHTQSAGLAGTGYVNDFTGALTTSFEDYSWDSEILSLGVSHVYNSYYAEDTQPSLNVGKGFMLNLQESITPVTINGTSLYKYIDGDGTQHYFQYSDSKWTDDSGLDLTLTINTSDYTIKDKSDNLRVFNKTTGYLTKIQDNDGNKITLVYTDDGSTLRYAYDDAGNEANFNQNSSGQLVKMTITRFHDDSNLRFISFTYDSNGCLTQVTFPGKSTVNVTGTSGAVNIAQFGYTSQGSLNSLIDSTNGMHVDYNYESWATSNKVRRISNFSVYDTANNLESSYSMAYSSHCTRFTENTPNLGRNQVYVFNYMGQTVSAQDQDDNALFCATGLSGGAKNKVTFSSKAQQSITNLLKNHDFKDSSSALNYYYSTGPGTFSADTSNAFCGSHCLKVVTSSSYSTIAGEFQSVTLSGGRTYTLSAYIKTSAFSTGGADLKMEAINGNNAVAATAETDKIVSESGYLRYETTIDLSSLTGSYTLMAYFGVKGGAGTAYFDSVQLEKGACSNRYNLVENGDFMNAVSGTWTEDGTGSSDGLAGDVTRHGSGNDNSYKFSGTATTSKKLYQTVAANGQADDCYVFGCWVKSTGLVNKDNGDGTKQCLGMTLKFANTDGTNTFKNILITPTSDEWQYICASAIAAKAYSSVTIYLKFVYNRNYAWFDDVQLYKDSFGDSFTYDSNGNVISVVDKAKDTASAAVNGYNDTTSYTDGKGQTYSFGYNNDGVSTSTSHNLTSSVAPDNTYADFAYDSHGNVTATEQHDNNGNSHTITSSINYTGDGAYKTSSTDQRGLSTTYSYDQYTGLLTQTAIPVGPLANSNMLTTSNTYNSDTRRLTLISSSFVDTTLKYFYEENRPSSIQIGNDSTYQKYNYAYDSAGNLTSVSHSSSGNTTPTSLESYSYLAGRGLKSSQTYANGQTLNYSYDNQDRLTGVSAGSSQISKYIYNGNGLLGKTYSYGGNSFVTTNQYDLAERLISSLNSNGSGIYNVSYDKNNLATGYVSYLRDGSANLEYTSAYTYVEKDSNGNVASGVDKALSDTIKAGTTTLLSTNYGYDHYGRLNVMITAADTSVLPVTVGYSYLDVDSSKTTTMPSGMGVRYTSQSGDGVADIVYNQTYDRAGNITNITTALKNGPTYVKTYGYDDLSRLTSATNVANSGDNYAYTYDGRNNITGSTVTNNGTTTQSKSYTYATDDIDRLSSFSHTATAGTVTRNYTYDATGNPTAIAETDSSDNSTRNLALTWTQGKLLSNISDSSTLNNTYSYDADGNVSKKTLADGSYVVYHYSDGTLEYEEHFNASSVLQEVLKYFYDTDGNVEYLLYKDDNFSNAGVYDLYYYVRNTVGDITELIQVRQQSGSTTTVVNQLAAHYEYDPYGNILSVNTYNNDNIGNINPIRYKDYYYDAQTGWYQLSSRFYDPETGRFLNADDVSLITDTDSNVVDKNLYAYCDGNPVMRKDNGGECWQIAAAIAGGVIGAAFEAASQLSESGKITSVGSIAYAAGVGAISAVIPYKAAEIIFTGVSTLAQDLKSAKKINGSTLSNALLDAGVSAGLTYVCGKSLGNKVSSKISAYSKPKVIANSIKSTKKAIRNAHIYKALKNAFRSYQSSKFYYFYHYARYHK